MSSLALSLTAKTAEVTETDSLPSQEFLELFNRATQEIKRFPIWSNTPDITPGHLILGDMNYGNTLPHPVYIRPIAHQEQFKFGPRWGIYFYSSRTPSDEIRSAKSLLRDYYDDNEVDLKQKKSWIKQALQPSIDTILKIRSGTICEKDNKLIINLNVKGIIPENITKENFDRRISVLQELSFQIFMQQLLVERDFQWFYFQPNFYSDAIHPYLSVNDFTSPIKWATACIEIVHGHAKACLSHDYRPLVAESAFKEMAQIMGNIRPQELEETREFQLDTKAKEAISELRHSSAKRPSPEMHIFVLDNLDHISIDGIKSEEFKKLTGSITKALESGLNIYQASRLFQFLHTQNPQIAINQTEQIISAVFCRENLPWWFNSNFDFSKHNLKAEELIKIADIAGHAFEGTLDLYYSKGKSLSTFTQIDLETAIHFCSLVIKNYGVGNQSRANNIVQYAIDLMAQYGASGSKDALSGLEESLLRERPCSEIVAVLEGSEVNFHKPGITNFFRLFGHAPTRENKIDEMTSVVAHFQDLKPLLSLPLEVRAFNPVPLINTKSTTSLLGTHIKLAKNPELLVLSSPLVNPPAIAWHDFERQLSKEIKGSRKERTNIADLYLGFFAAKMPDPLRPPAGFLAFLEIIDSVKDPKHVHVYPGFRSNYWKILENNRNLSIQKYAAISSVMDARLLGLISAKATNSLFDWIIAPLSQKEITKIEIECTYRAKDELLARAQYLAAELLNHHQSLETKLQTTLERGKPKDRYLLIDNTFTRDSWLLSQEEDLRTALSDVEKHYNRTTSGRYMPETDDNFRLENLSFEINEENNKRSVYQAISNQEYKQRQNRLEKFCSLAPNIFNLNLIVAAGILDSREHSNCLDALVMSLMNEPESLLTNIEEYPTIGREEAEDNFSGQSPEIKNRHLDKKLIDLATLFEPKRVSSFLTENITTWEGLQNVVDEIKLNLLGIEKLQILIETRSSEILEIPKLQWHASLLKPKAKVLDEIYPGWMHEHFLRQCSETILAAVKSINSSLPSSERSLGIANHALLGSFLMQHMIAEIDQQTIEASAIESLSSRVQSLQISTLVTDERIKHFKAAVNEFRAETLELLPIGCKLHLHSEIDPNKLKALELIAPFEFTGGFKLDNARDCLVLPAVTSARELVEIARLLVEFKIIKPEFPEYQFCIRGRMNPQNCAALAITILLSAQDNPDYTPDMFATNREEVTGKRMMIYDAHGPIAMFPGNPNTSSIIGRTDIIGLIDISRAPTFQLIGTILSNGEFGGVLKDLAKPFIQDLKALLSRYVLLDTLKHSWIKGDHEGQNAANDHFFKGIMPCLNAWKKALNTFEQDQFENKPNIILEIRSLIDLYGEKAKLIRQMLVNDPEFTTKRKVLFFEN